VELSGLRQAWRVTNVAGKHSVNISIPPCQLLFLLSWRRRQEQKGAGEEEGGPRLRP
jgi:hypothetical protein